MTDQLRTPFVHRLIASPAGAAFETGVYERLKLGTLPREFRTMRARAVADATAADGVDAFLDALGATDPLSADRREALEDGLAVHRERRRARDEAVDRWETAFWGDAGYPSDDLVTIDRERRQATERWLRGAPFVALATAGSFPPVDLDVPDPEAVLVDWQDGLDDPSSVYAAPGDRPAVEESATLLGPNDVEYLVRFPSPSPYVDDHAYARVYEPVDDGEALPTLVYGSGLGMTYDQVTYWPEEEYLGRALAPRGYRVVLPESPWHGRREQPGRFSGEPYLARPPVSLWQLYAAQAQETAVLVEWARSRGAPAVGVGGVSLGGIVALLVAGFSRDWPEERRPDAVFPVAASAAIDRLLVESRLTAMLGIREALRDAGWTDDRLRAVRPLLTPPDEPGVEPAAIYPFSGLADEVATYGPARTLLDRWGVPERNRTEWHTGHFGTLIRVIRVPVLRDAVATVLDRQARAVPIPIT